MSCGKCCTYSGGGIGMAYVTVVTETDPVDGAVDVPTNSPILVTFSDPVNAGTANEGTFALEPPVPGTYAPGPSPNQVEFTPSGNMPPGQLIVARLNGILTVEGVQTLAHTFVFTTA